MLSAILYPLLLATHPVPVHAIDADMHRHIEPVLERKTFYPRDGEMAVAASERFDRIIYGYYPYWADHDEDIPWEHLTHLAYFCVSINADGSLGDDHSWGTRGAQLVQAGQSQGVRVVLTATMFDRDEIREVLSTADNRTRAIDNLLEIVQDAGADGINIDFEFVPEAQAGESPSPKQNFVTFMADLTTAFHAAIESSHVSLASPAVDWGGTYDYDQLALVTDGLMIMGYGYHWSGGNPGPLSPIVGGGIWGERSLTWTIEDYFAYGGEENKDHFILGLPLYGREWPSTDLNVPGTATDAGPAKSLASCDNAFGEGKLWDETTSTPYKLFLDGEQPKQLFCEDLESLQAKFDLIESYNLGGVMFWDVGKVGGSHAVWPQVSTTYAANEQPEEPTDTGDLSDPTGSASNPSDVADPGGENPGEDASDPSDREQGGCRAAQGDSPWILVLLFGVWLIRRRIGRPQICGVCL